MSIPTSCFSRQLSLMDVVDAVNDSNLILPAGDVKMGPYDYYVYSNSLVDNPKDLNSASAEDGGPTVGLGRRRGQDRGRQPDSVQLVRVDGQRSVYLPIMKQGGDTNTIDVVNGIRTLIAHLFDIPSQLKPAVVFDQSAFVKDAIDTLLHEGLIGLVLTSLMILMFLGSLRATVAVLLSIPLSALATFVILYADGQHRQYDDSGWAGAGLLARDRQLGHLARKHLPPSGDGGIRRKWRRRRAARK